MIKSIVGYVVIKIIVGYVVGVLYALDQLVNRITFGKADHTISGRCGYWSVKGNGVARVLEVFIDSLFFWQDSHCRNSIEYDEVEPYKGKIYPKIKVNKKFKVVLGLIEYGVILFGLFW